MYVCVYVCVCMFLFCASRSRRGAAPPRCSATRRDGLIPPMPKGSVAWLKSSLFAIKAARDAGGGLYAW